MRNLQQANLDQQKGFSLVELLVVVAILSILTSVAVVTVTGHKKSARVDAAKTFLHQLSSALEICMGIPGRKSGNCNTIDKLDLQKPKNVKNPTPTPSSTTSSKICFVIESTPDDEFKGCADNKGKITFCTEKSKFSQVKCDSNKCSSASCP